MQAAIYTRVSTEDQAQGYSLDSQLRALRALAKERGYTVAMEASDDTTGSVLERPGLTRVRDAARAGTIQRILIYDPDRLARKLVFQLVVMDEAEKHGCQIEYATAPVTKTNEDRLLLQVRGVISEYERLKIRERTLRGRREKAKQGRVVGGPATFGYTCTEGKDGGVLSIDAAMAPVVKEIFERCARGQSIRSITRWLNGCEARPFHGGDWQKSSVQRILKNETYAGQAWYYRRQRNGDAARTERERSEWIPIPAPAIISRDLFDAVASRLEANRTALSGRPSSTYLLRGLLTCAHCGKRFGGQRCHGSRSYRCNGRCADAVQLDANNCEAAVWAAMTASLTDADSLRRIVVARLAEMRANWGGESTAKLEQRIALLHKREERTVRLLMDASLTDHERMLRSELATCRQQRQEAEAQLKTLATQSDVLASVDGVAKALRSTMAKAGSDDARRQEVLRLLIRGISVSGRKLVIAAKPATALARFGQFEVVVQAEVA